MMSKLVLALFMIFTLKCCTSDGIKSKQEHFFSVRQLGQSMSQCFDEHEIINCFKNKISETLDKVIASNTTWQLNDFLVIEKNTYPPNKDNAEKLEIVSKKDLDQGLLSNSLALKILQLAQTRSFKIQLPSSSLNKLFYKRSINSALDDFNAADSDGKSEAFGAIKQQLEQEEGRRKKDKDKNMAIVGGMAMLAMVAQMFLGKVILIAGAAFVMAKVALLISALGSLKKGTSGSGTYPEHVIVTGGSIDSDHSYEHISGWHRSNPKEYKNIRTVEPDAHKFIKAVNYNKRNQYFLKPPTS